MKRTLSAVVSSTALCLLLFGGTADAGGFDYCAETARAQKKACDFERKDDFWNAAGRCLNSGERLRACLVDSLEERRDAREECGDRLAARLELCDEFGPGPFAPDIDPAGFLSPAEIAAAPNPFFPLVPGTVYTYQGGAEKITVTVTAETKNIFGVTCLVVNDVVEEDGEVIEDTDDWYAQDIHGNVWYFGEIAMNFKGGELTDLEGSWKAGVDGAAPGIIMPASPVVGVVYRQEFLLGDAEDVAEVLSLAGTATVPAPGASCAGSCLVTADWIPIEPDVTEYKYYAPGIGPVLEVNPETGERVELVSVSP